MILREVDDSLGGDNGCASTFLVLILQEPPALRLVDLMLSTESAD